MTEVLIKSKEDLERELQENKKFREEMVEKWNGVSDVDERLGQLAEDMKESKEALAKIGTRFRTDQTDKVLGRLPVSREELEKDGFSALYKAPTRTRLSHYEGETPIFDAAEGPIAKWQEAGDNLQIIAAMLRRPPEKLKYFGVYKERLAAVKSALKDAMDTATGDPGVGDWIPNEMSGQLVPKVRLTLRVMGLFPEITMPRSPFDVPIWLNDMTGFLITENAAVTSQTPISDAAGTTEITGNVRMTAAGIGGLVGVTKFAEEDSIIPVLPFVTGALAQAIGNALEDAALNGDDSGTHQDSDVTAASDRRKAWKGLRFYALQGAATEDAGGVKINTDANWRDFVQNLRGKMGVFGRRPTGVVSLKLFNQLMAIPNFRTLQNFGNAATVFGQDLDAPAFMPDGIRIVTSEFQREDLNASGVQDGVTTDRTTMILVDPGAWLRGALRRMTVQTLREIWAIYDQDAVLATWRGSFVPVQGASASLKHTGIVFNIGT